MGFYLSKLPEANRVADQHLHHYHRLAIAYEYALHDYLRDGNSLGHVKMIGGECRSPGCARLRAARMQPL